MEKRGEGKKGGREGKMEEKRKTEQSRANK